MLEAALQCVYYEREKESNNSEGSRKGIIVLAPCPLCPACLLCTLCSVLSLAIIQHTDCRWDLHLQHRTNTRPSPSPSPRSNVKT